MKRWAIRGAALGMLLLILDSRCAAQSVRDAITLCLKSVIPSLFPMFVLSGMLISGIGGSSGRALSFLERMMGLPRGSGGLFLLGVLGGFPVGAQCIAQAVERGTLSKANGEQMLGFYNNCSPAFLFGIVGGIFSSPMEPMMLLLIQLETAMIVASLADFQTESDLTLPTRECSLPEAVTRGVRSMVSVCAWVVLAGVVTGFLKRWLYPLLPEPVCLLVSGVLEITGGILGLGSVSGKSLRFLMSAFFVCFGGLSVWMQIASAVSTQGLSPIPCFRQKTAQAVLGVVLGAAVLLVGPAGLLTGMIPLVIRKKTLEKPKFTVYNSSHKGGYDHVVS